MTEEELREKLEAIIDEPGGGLSGVTERKAARIMQLIKADREAVVREARIDELNSLVTRLPVDEFGDQGYVLNLKARGDILERITQLQSHQPTNTKEKE